MKAILLILTAGSLLFGAYSVQTINGDAVVYDDETGLTWQNEPYTQAEEDAYNADTESGKVLYWENAIDYCEALDFAGETDWRLPNINELLSMTDMTRVDPAVDPAFTNVTSYYYWSSTTYACGTTHAWGVYFYDGYGTIGDKTDSRYVRCVRSGQIVPSASAVSVPLSPWARFAMLLLFGLAGFGFVRRTKARSL